MNYKNHSIPGPFESWPGPEWIGLCIFISSIETVMEFGKIYAPREHSDLDVEKIV